MGLIGAGRMGKVFAHTLAFTVPAFMERFADAYAAEVRDFVSCILEDRTPSVTGEDARKATAIGMAATLSLDEVRPVMISEIG